VGAPEVARGAFPGTGMAISCPDPHFATGSWAHLEFQDSRDPDWGGSEAPQLGGLWE
jgi:hypothetical protein